LIIKPVKDRAQHKIRGHQHSIYRFATSTEFALAVSFAPDLLQKRTELFSQFDSSDLYLRIVLGFKDRVTM
jgi:hypothetical protein